MSERDRQSQLEKKQQQQQEALGGCLPASLHASRSPTL